MLIQHAPEYVRGLGRYVPGKPIADLARELGLDPGQIIKLASNENPLGMSSVARAAMRDAMDDLARYPDGGAHDFRRAVAQHHDLSSGCVVPGNGSNEILELVARAFLAPGGSALFSEHAFAVYSLVSQAAGAECIEVPSRNFGHDLAAMADAIRMDTRVVFIANPNNPSGSFLPGVMIEQFLARVPANVLVVLDEAYNQYVPEAFRYDSVSWLKKFPNLLLTRTFSKIYGMAGLRVGYGLCAQPVSELLDRVRQPFNLNSLAQAAACGALSDASFVARSAELNQSGLRFLSDRLAALGLQVLPSCANFLCFRVGDGRAINQLLLRSGVIVRPLASYGMPEWLRVTVGTSDENERFVVALETALRGRDV